MLTLPNLARTDRWVRTVSVSLCVPALPSSRPRLPSWSQTGLAPAYASDPRSARGSRLLSQNPISIA